jgi:UDP-glucose 4-epimerase
VKVLITGGAGYIGSTVGSALEDAGHQPVILDNLVTGRREFTVGRPFYEGDIADALLVDRIFAEHPDIEAVVHCAALIVVPDSVADPIGYYDANVVKSLRLFDSLVRNGCGRVVFSSSASIYAVNETFTVDETSPLGPISPYARTKAVCEQMFADIATSQPVRVVSLRYFNPVGADPKMRTGLQLAKPTHALGMMIDALNTGEAFPVTGIDYPTRDGTGIRDYIHVWDLAAAHVAALERFDMLLPGQHGSLPINLGTGHATTVRELLDAFNRVAPTPITHVDAPRRPGDSVGAYTNSERAHALLGWSAAQSLDTGIADTLRWFDLRRQVIGFP